MQGRIQDASIETNRWIYGSDYNQEKPVWLAPLMRPWGCVGIGNFSNVPSTRAGGLSPVDKSRTQAQCSLTVNLTNAGLAYTDYFAYFLEV
jgi:hypothetical protein